jgi:hypothetical protein
MLELNDRIRAIQSAGGLSYKPQLFALTLQTGVKYPSGIEVLAQEGQISEEGLPQEGLRFPVGRVNITKPEAFGQLAGFQLLGELRIGMQDEAWQFMEKFTELGAVRSGDDYVLLVDVASLMQEIQNDGDLLLDNPQVMVGEAANLLMFTTTCRRGLQSFSVVLKNGETTQAVKVMALLMNRISGFEIRNAPRGISRLELGQTISGLKIHGLGPGLRDSDPNNLPPDLTNLPACLDMASSAPNVVELVRQQTFSLQGRASGKSDLQVLLIGSATSPDHPEVAATFPIDVAGLTMDVSDKAAMNFNRSSWNFTLEYQVKALSGGFTVLSKNQMLQFGTQTLTLDLRGALANVTPPEIDAYELTVKVTNLKPLKGQTLEPGYAWVPHFNFIDNNEIKGPSATFRFQVTRGKTFSSSLGVHLAVVHTATGTRSNGDRDWGLHLTILKNP